MTDEIATYRRCADLIRASDGIFLAAGAGMGVDSGLPDFRGNEGLWRAYPALGRSGISFSDIANPDQFRISPRLAWGFYGHRLHLYRETIPHDGFSLLLSMASQLKHGMFVFTSNVDGQFQKAGFHPEQIHECHGSIHFLQCIDGCLAECWPADPVQPVVDLEKCRYTGDLPVCPHCGKVARPNLLMFADGTWNSDRYDLQEGRMLKWLSVVSKPVAIEIGAGSTIPTVRRFVDCLDCPIIRINPTDARVGGKDDIGVPMGGLAALRAIYTELLGHLPHC